MRRLSRPPLTVGAVCLSACLSAADPAGEPRETTVLAVTVVDSTGAPVPGSLVEHHFWPDTAPWWQYEPAQLTDSLGRVLIDLTTALVTRLDSLDVAFSPPGCGFAGRYAVVQASTLYGGSDDTARVELRTGPTRPPARTAPGEYCAFGYPAGWPGPFDGRDMFFALRVDSLVGPLAYGRWETWFRSSKVGSWGPFVAGHGSTFVAFHLAVDSAPPWDPCTEFRFTAPVRPDGTWGTASVIEPNGCFYLMELPIGFDFVEERTFIR